MADSKAEIAKRKAENIAASAKGSPEEDGAATSTRQRQIPAREQGVALADDTYKIRLDRIIADPDQPRKEFEPGAIESLAESLLARGQLMPIRARYDEASDRWIVVAGERRLRAAMLAGLEYLLVVASNYTNPDDVLEDSLVENLLRVDLAPLEKAEGFRKMMSRGLTAQQVAEKLSITGAQVSMALALLDLPEAVQEQVKLESLTPSAAYEVSKIDDPAVQEEVAKEVVDKKLGRSETRARVKEAKAEVEAKKEAAGSPKKKARGPKAKPPVKFPTTWFRKLQPSSHKLIIEHPKGVNPDDVLSILKRAVSTLEDELRAAG